jgi:tRNA (guanine37-N1)-methyltransferase
VLFSAAGEPYTQKKAREYAGLEHLILIAGHYEGFDARILDEADEQICMGDYILSGGEIPAMAVIDSIVRLLGVIRTEDSW